MYKAGKRWLFGALVAATVLGGMGVSYIMFTPSSIVTAAPTNAAYQLQPGQTIKASHQVAFTDDSQASRYFNLQQSVAGGAMTSSEIAQWPTTIVNQLSQNGNVVMKNKFDMSTSVSLAGTFRVGASKQAPDESFQGPGDGLGVILADVAPDEIASGDPGDGDTHMGIVGLPSNALFMGWDMFANEKLPEGQTVLGFEKPNSGSFPLRQLNVFTQTADGKAVQAVTAAGASAELPGKFTNNVDFLPDTTADWSFSWTPDSDFVTTGAGTLTYTMSYDQGNGQQVVPISYHTTVPKTMAIAMHMSTGWAWSDTTVDVQKANFLAAAGKVVVNYLGADKPMAASTIEGNVGDTFGFGGAEAEQTFTTPTAPAGEVAMMGQPTGEFTQADQTRTVVYVSDPAAVKQAADTAASDNQAAKGKLDQAKQDANLTPDQLNDPRVKNEVDAYNKANDALDDAQKQLNDTLANLDSQLQTAIDEAKQATTDDEANAASKKIDDLNNAIKQAEEDAKKAIDADQKALDDLLNALKPQPSEPSTPSEPADLGTALNNAIATVVQAGHPLSIYDTPNGKIATKTLVEGSDWKAFRQYQDDQGVTWYNLGSQQWVKAAGIILDGQPGSYRETRTVGTVTATKGAEVMDAPGHSGKATGQVLKAKTDWQISASVVTTDGQKWYRVGTNQWVKADTVALQTSQPFTGVAVIDYAKGYGINVWRNPQATASTGKRLATGSEWKIFAKAVGQHGRTFYNVGGQQWIDSRYVKLRTDAASHKIAKNTTTIKYVPGFGIKTWTAPTGTQKATPVLAHGSQHQVIATETVNGTLWYQLGPQVWVQAQYTHGVK